MKSLGQGPCRIYIWHISVKTLQQSFDIYFSSPSLFSNFWSSYCSGPPDKLYKMTLHQQFMKLFLCTFTILLNSYLLDRKKWHLLIFIYSVTSDVESNFVYLLATCISFIKCLFMVFAHFPLECSCSIWTILLY